MQNENFSSINGFSNNSSTSINFMDELIKEYLLFRGFNSSLKTFETDSKLDKDKCLKADKVVDQLFQFIHSFDFNGLHDYWSYLDSKYFSRLTLKLTGSISLTRKYELFLYRYYLIFSIQSNKTEKVLEFFEKQATQHQSQAEWKDWYCLPFIKCPEENSIFSVYFSKNWIDSFYISLQNFLNIVFQSLQYPRLLNYEEDSFWTKQSGQIKNNLSYDQESICLTDEFHVSDNNSQNKPSNSLISIFKNFKSNKAPVSKTNLNPSKNMRKDDLNDKAPSNKSILTNTLSNPIGLVHNKVEDLSKQFHTSSLNDLISQPINNTTLIEDKTDLNGQNNPFLILSQEDFNDHQYPINICKVSRDGKYVASVDSQGIAKIWSLDDKTNSINTLNIISVEWDKKANKIIYLGTSTSNIKVYDISQKKVIQELELNKALPNTVHICSSPLNGKVAIVISENNQTKDKNTLTNQLIICQSNTTNNNLKIEKIVNLENFNCRCIITCNYFILGSPEGILKFYDSDQLKFSLSVSAHTKAILNISTNSDQKRLFTFSNDNTIKIWLIEQSGPKIKLFKNIDVSYLNITDNLNDLIQKNLIAIDSSEKYAFILNKNGVNSIEIVSNDTTNNSLLSIKTNSTILEIWNARHSSILFVGYFDGSIRIFKLLCQI